MTDQKKDQRLQLVISSSEITAIDEWRRQQRDLPSRSEAIRRLIKLGLVQKRAVVSSRGLSD